jgi:hypothetical protein
MAMKHCFVANNLHIRTDSWSTLAQLPTLIILAAMQAGTGSRHGDIEPLASS